MADSLAALGQPETILVMPDGDDGFYRTWVHPWSLDSCAAGRSRPETFCVEHQRYDTYIVQDLRASAGSSCAYARSEAA